MTIEGTALPGVSVRHDLTTRTRQRLGVITHTIGQRGIVLDDPDRAACTLSLEIDEGYWIADLLGTTVTIDHLANLEQQLTAVTAPHLDFVLHHDDTRVAVGEHHGVTPSTDLLTNASSIAPAGP